jgi:thiaminase/transcriptional activator TenA
MKVAETWTQQLWAQGEPIYAAILDHPFLKGLTSGELDEACFAYYLAQDSHYLREYSKALAVVAAKAPEHAITGMFARHAAQSVEVEFALHAALLPALGLDPERLGEVPVSPTTTAYTSYVLAAAYGGTFAEALAAVLPCYWIYQRVGAQLVAQGSPDSRYQQWIDTYAGEQFAATVAEVLEVADHTGADLPAAQARRAGAHFRAASRYEWMFWDAGWRRERWPV